jgi:hypothetical protein
VIDVFSFILLIYHPRRIYASGLFRRDCQSCCFSIEEVCLNCEINSYANAEL